jgi:hypothetical protein
MIPHLKIEMWGTRSRFRPGSLVYFPTPFQRMTLYFVKEEIEGRAGKEKAIVIDDGLVCSGGSF